MQTIWDTITRSSGVTACVNMALQCIGGARRGTRCSYVTDGNTAPVTTMHRTPALCSMLKVHMANIKSADQIALTITLLAFRT